MLQSTGSAAHLTTACLKTKHMLDTCLAVQDCTVFGRSEIENGIGVFSDTLSLYFCSQEAAEGVGHSPTSAHISVHCATTEI